MLISSAVGKRQLQIRERMITMMDASMYIVIKPGHKFCKCNKVKACKMNKVNHRNLQHTKYSQQRLIHYVIEHDLDQFYRVG